MDLDIDTLQQNDIRKKEKLLKQSKPNFLTKLFVSNPFLVISTCLLFFAVSIILTVQFQWFRKSKDTDRDWLIWNNDLVKKFDTFNEIQQLFKRNSLQEEVPLQTQDIQDWETYIMLECGENCNNVLTTDTINMLLKLETKIKSHKYYNKFCLKSPENKDNECGENSLISFTSMFSEYQQQQGITQQELQFSLDFSTREEIFPFFKFLFGKNYSKNNQKSKYLLSILKFGSPIETNEGFRYMSQYDSFSEQEKYFLDFQHDIIEITRNFEEKYQSLNVNILPYSKTQLLLQIDQVVFSDSLLVIGSILFVWVYITFHIKSIFLSTCSMFGIIMSFPLTLFVYRLILQVDYYNSIHVMIIFVVLGIAADDIFIFIDAWNQTENCTILKNNLNGRMAVTFKRAAKSMLATSLTTSAAFTATGVSKIMPISSFGLFASILIPMNFVLVITFFPAILIVHIKYVKNWKLYLQKCKNLTKYVFSMLIYYNTYPKQSPQSFHNETNTTNNKNDEKNDNESISDIELHQGNKKLRIQQLDSTNQSEDINPQQLLDSSDSDKEQDYQQQKLSKIDSFFSYTFNNFIFKFRYVFLCLTLIWIMISINAARKMGPLSKPDQWLPDNFKIQRIINHLQDDMHTSGKGGMRIKVNIYWGVLELDKSQISMWDQQNIGNIVWDNNFDLSYPQNQQYMFDLCNQLLQNELVQDQEIQCFMLDFQQYITKDLKTHFPVQQKDFLQHLQQFMKSDIGLQYYLNNQIGIFDDKLKYVSLELTSIGNPDLIYQDMQEIQQKWENQISQFNINAPKGLEKGAQCSYNWAWMVSQKAFIDNALQGIIISILFSSVVLFLATRNFMVSLFSILSIMGILVSVVHIMFLQGWEIGIAESITIVILNGFSVDYVVHLANHYIESSYIDRYSKMKESLTEIGVSILSGSITTLGSGIFLIFSNLTLFLKFSIIILTTITFSVYFSLFFFSSLMHILGPQQSQRKMKKYTETSKQKSIKEQELQQHQQNIQQSQETVRELNAHSF